MICILTRLFTHLENWFCMRKKGLWLCAGRRSDVLSLLFIDEQPDTISLLFKRTMLT